ncbi:hypothetical protein ACTJLA_08795, partial [Pseudomonas sp. 22072]
MREHGWCEVLRTHLYLYVQAYAIERPTFEMSLADFFRRRAQALIIKAWRFDEISYGGVLQQRGFVTTAWLCVTLGRSVTNWCAVLGTAHKQMWELA